MPITQRNLIYFVYPLRSTPVWRWNLHQLRQRWECFNGRKTVAVACNPYTVSVADVRKQLPKDCEFLAFPNRPRLGEVVAFRSLLETVKDDCDPGSATFYAHAKGIKHPPSEKYYLYWTAIMYSSMLDYLPLVDEWLAKVPFVGPITCGRSHVGGGGVRISPWHFAGTFFWFRTAHIFSLPTWENISPRWGGTEAWPGRVIPDPGQARGIVIHDLRPPRLGFHNLGIAGMKAAWNRFVEDNKRYKNATYQQLMEGAGIHDGQFA